jgi:hypothetical protein
MLLTFSFAPVFGQIYGNEWIDYSQSYYSFKVSKTGIHKLDYNTLIEAGIPTSLFTSDNIQMFGRQKEIPIQVVDGGNNMMNPGDYILFYAEKNNGWLDSTLYDDPNTIGNPSYSLYNDTIHYFFTWSNQTNNLRFSLETDINHGSISQPASFWFAKAETSYNSFYVECRDANNVSSSSKYMPGEGWSSNHVNGINGYTFNLAAATPNPYIGANAPLAEFHGISVSNSNAWNNLTPGGNNHSFTWKIGALNNVLHDEQFVGYQQKNIKVPFATSFLTNGNTPIRYTINASTEYASDFQSISYWSVTYPKLTTLNGQNKGTFSIVNNQSQNKVRLDIANANLVNPIMLVFGSEPKIITVTNNGGNNWQALIPNSLSGEDQLLVIEDKSNSILVSALNPVGINAKFVNYNTVQNDSNVLIMVTHHSLQDATNEYATYRESIAGGSFKVVSADINQLYLQYGGGIEKHVLGIRRFAHQLNQTALVEKPKALFLIGKGIREVAGTRKNASLFAKSLIPSFGYPSSDVMITARLENTEWEPLIPTGRISVKTNQQLRDYLAKVVQFDAQQDPQSTYNQTNKDWQKQVLHFAGGSTAADQNEFQSYLNNMKSTIETDDFGGNVKTFRKTTSSPLDPITIAEVGQRISNGVSLMNFFGHATADGFEINVDEPTNWNNQGKYPLMIGNACYSGDIFQDFEATSEKFVMTPQEGAIAFISSVTTSYAFSLNQYTSEFYRQLAKTNYGKTISEQMKNTIVAIKNNFGNNVYTETISSQMVLHGDPLLKLNWHQKSEIDLTQQSIFFRPENINLSVDSLEVNVVLSNLGKSVTDTFTLEIKRVFPNGIDSNYTFFIPRLDYKDTISFKVPLQADIGVGLNYFNVSADIPSAIPEFEEWTNNQVSKLFLINIDGISPIWPYDFAIVPRDSVTLKASTINPVAAFNTYRFEIDTTDLFNSPQHRFADVSGLGGVKEVNPSQWKKVLNNQNFPLQCTDSTVYFWRVAVDSSILNWQESSFQYIQGKTGWGQDHFFQFKKNLFSNLVYDRSIRERKFDAVPRTFNVDVYDSPTSNQMIYAVQFKMDNQMIDYSFCSATPSLHVAVFDPVTLEAWGKRINGLNPRHYFGNANDGAACRNRVENYFLFRQNNPTQMESFRSMILDSVPDGHFILVYTSYRATYAGWDNVTPSLRQTFQDLGATQIGTGPDKAFAFFYRKGDPNFIHERVATQTAPGELLNINLKLTGSQSKGEEKSTLIGPSSLWETLYWKQDPKENPSFDSTRITIEGLNMSSGVLFTMDTLMTRKDSILDLNNLISAQDYPMLRLKATYIDKINLNPAKLDRWHVLYQPLPEAAIDGSSSFTWTGGSTDTLQEGQKFKFAIDVKNISDHPMDSLLISYWIQDANQVKHFVPYNRQDSLRVTQVIRDTVEFSTLGLSGLNSLWMEVNPYVNGSLITDQPEQFHYNNLLQIPFYVSKDNVNPILDVTFDGLHILNGDIISPKSEIVISLKDENPWLVMNEISDTTLFGIYLTDPTGNQKRIHFMDGNGNTVLQWIPAESQHKRFKIIYSGEFQMDGKYTLMVQGADRSGNLSGDLQYKITFEVIRESSITYLMNYPNPFSTSTQFVFTLTGSEVPDEIIIQIMTVTGKVVREITEDQIGPLHIGRNVSQYAWDGRDEFGDQLANGVYLYRVLSQIKGEDIKHRDSGADIYFKKEFGKMYLMR